MDQMCMTLGGRASEEIFFGKVSTGAQNDLQQVTRIAYSMVTIYGMNEKVGNLSFYDPQQENVFTKPYSDDTGRLIDDEVRKLVDQAYRRTIDLLTEKRAQAENLAQALLQREVLHQQDVEDLLGKRPFEEKKLFSEEEAATEAAEPSTVAPTEDASPAAAPEAAASDGDPVAPADADPDKP